MSKHKKYSMLFEYYGIKPQKTLEEATPQQQVGFFPSLVAMGDKIPSTELSKISDFTNKLLAANTLPPVFEKGKSDIQKAITKFGIEPEKATKFIQDIEVAYKQKQKAALVQAMAGSKKQNIPEPVTGVQFKQKLPNVEDISVLKKAMSTITDEKTPKPIKSKVLKDTMEDIKNLGAEEVANMIAAELKSDPKNPFGTNKELSPFGKFYAKLFQEVFGTTFDKVSKSQTMAQTAKLFRR